MVKHTKAYKTYTQFPPSPGFHAWFYFHRFVGARHHSHKHLPGLWVVLSLQVFIHTVLYVHSQSCRLQPYSVQTNTREKL